MAQKSSIQWTDATWNIARGCSKVDADCLYCYMFRESLSETRYKPKEVVRTKTVFNLPLKLKEPSKIFTSSLTDFFHEDIDSYRNEAWDIIRKCPQHTFQILTKRPERIVDHLPEDWGDFGWDNVWLGTSVGNQKGINRSVHIMAPEAKIKFLSLEPLYGEVDITEPTIRFDTIDADFYILPAFGWVIVGGESGNDTGKFRYRECKIEWIEKIVKDCQANQIPVFVKQLGTYLSKQYGLKDRHGGNMDEWPESLNHLKIRQFPRS